MSETLFGLVSSHGLIVIFAMTFLSCLALPVPSSFVMLAGGAFVASGDLVLWQVLAAAFAGAVLGDQLGFHAGRWGGPALVSRLEARPRRAAVVARSRAVLARWGGTGVFFTTWAASPLGPYVNALAGALGMARWRFTLADTVGEAIWVALYVGLGVLFASRIAELAALASNAVGFVTAGSIALVLGRLLFDRLRRRTAPLSRAPDPG
jgi:membrane-associated protein